MTAQRPGCRKVKYIRWLQLTKASPPVQPQLVALSADLCTLPLGATSLYHSISKRTRSMFTRGELPSYNWSLCNQKNPRNSNTVVALAIEIIKQRSDEGGYDQKVHFEYQFRPTWSSQGECIFRGNTSFPSLSGPENVARRKGWKGNREVFPDWDLMAFNPDRFNGEWKISYSVSVSAYSSGSIA